MRSRNRSTSHARLQTQLRRIDAHLASDDAQKPVSRSDFAKRVFDQAFSRELGAVLDPQDAIELRRASALRRRALEACRAHKYHSGGRLLDESSATGNRLHSSEAVLVESSFQAAACAYLAYARGDVKEALSLINRAMKVDLRLVEESGITLLCLHRCQLAQNYVRVAGTSAEWAEVASVARGVLQWLDGDNDAWPLGPTTPKRVLRGLSEAIREATRAEFVGLLGDLMLLAGDREVPGELRPLLEFTEVQWGDKWRGYPSRMWLVGKGLEVRGDLDGFLETRATMIQAADVPAILWFLGAVDVIRWAEVLRVPFAKTATNVAASLGRARGTPSGLRGEVDRLVRC